VVWCGLLLASLGALVVWETPKRAGSADLAIKIRIPDLPAGSTVQFWTGPRKAWPAADGVAPLNQAGTPLGIPAEAVSALKLRVAYRRWIGGTIARRTDDLVVLKFQPNTGAPRYFALPLDMDWHTGLLRPGQRMSVAATATWDGLWLDPASVPTSNR